MNKPFRLSAKVLVRNDAGLYLVIRRSAASKANAGAWDMPGGKIDPGEDMDAGLLREVVEETGLQVQLERVVGSAQSDLPHCMVAYLILEAVCTGGQLRLSDEHDAFAWAARNQLPGYPFCPQFQAFMAGFSAGRAV